MKHRREPDFAKGTRKTMIGEEEKRLIRALEVLGEMDAMYEKMFNEMNTCTRTDPVEISERCGIPKGGPLSWFLSTYEQWKEEKKGITLSVPLGKCIGSSAEDFSKHE